MPRVPVAAGASLVWVGAHGGAGTDVLAALLPGSHPLSGAWPEPGPESAIEAATPVVLVARTSAGALQAAARAATQWAAGGVPQVDLLGLVLVPDRPGRLPRELRRLQELVAGGVPRCWSLPWVEEWRRGAPVVAATAPAAHRRLVAELQLSLRGRHRRSDRAPEAPVAQPVAPPAGPLPAEPRPVAAPVPGGSPR